MDSFDAEAGYEAGGGHVGSRPVQYACGSACLIWVIIVENHWSIYTHWQRATSKHKGQPMHLMSTPTLNAFSRLGVLPLVLR